VIQERIRLESYARDIYEKAHLMWQQAENQQTASVGGTLSMIMEQIREMAKLMKPLDPVYIGLTDEEYNRSLNLNSEPARQPMPAKPVPKQPVGVVAVAPTPKSKEASAI
jgi:hypothetical protein